MTEKMTTLSSGSDGYTVTYYNEAVYAGAGNDTIVIDPWRTYAPDTDWTDSGWLPWNWEFPLEFDPAFVEGIVVYGEGGNDLIVNTSSTRAWIYGGDDNDTLIGGSAADYLDGGNGNDTLKGGGGADILNGGWGVDTANYEQSAAAVTISLYTDVAFGGDAEGDSLDSIENLTGSRYSDNLFGDDGVNVLSGGRGADNLKGYGGADSIYGGADNDTLYGMGGMDMLSGGDGNDRLDGGADGDRITGGMGRDTLIGGTGSDTFFWYSTEETGVTIAAADVVSDFRISEGDRLNLNGIDANVYAAGNQSFTFIGTAAFSGTPGEIRYYHADGYTVLELQTGVDADVEGVIRLAGILTPQASWFVL